jgi:O-antigen/teichoic acid export membrane protein
MAYSILIILLAVVVGAVIAYLVLKYRLAEDDIRSVITTTVIGTVIVCVAASFLLGWDLYEGAGYGIIGGVLAAMGLRLRYDAVMKKKRRQEKRKREQEQEKQGQGQEQKGP